MKIKKMAGGIRKKNMWHTILCYGVVSADGYSRGSESSITKFF